MRISHKLVFVCPIWGFAILAKQPYSVLFQISFLKKTDDIATVHPHSERTDSPLIKERAFQNLIKLRSYDLMVREMVISIQYIKLPINNVNSEHPVPSLPKAFACAIKPKVNFN